MRVPMFRWRLMIGLLALPALLLSACGDGGTGPTPPVDPAIAVVGTAQVGGVMNVRVRGATLGLAQYAGTLGGAPVVLVRMDDSTLVSLVPDIAAGSHELTAGIGSGSLATTVTVAAGLSIADPVAHVNTALDQAAADYPATAPEGMPQEEWTTQRDAFLADVAEAKAQVAAATPAQQLAAARLMEAVRAELLPITGRQSGGAPMSHALLLELTCGQAAGSALISGIAYYGAMAVVVAGAIVPGVNALVIVPGALLVVEVLPIVENDLQVMFATCDKQKRVALNGATPSGFTLASAAAPGGLPMSGAATTGSVTFGAAMLSDTKPTLANNTLGGSSALRMSFVRAVPVRTYPTIGIQDFSASHIPENATAARIESALAWVHNKVSELPALIRSYLPTLPSRPSSQGEQPIVDEAALPAAVRIANVTNGVSIAADADGAALLLTATATGSGDRDFTFDVISNEDPSVKQTYTAILRQVSPVQIRVVDTHFYTHRVHYEGGFTSECEMNWAVDVSGSDPIAITSLYSVNAREGEPTYTGTTFYAPNSLDEGTYRLQGSWWRSWASDALDWGEFTVTLSHSWKNLRTEETGWTDSITLFCNGI